MKNTTHSNDFTPARDDYAAATAVLEGNLQGLVRNEAVEPHWVGEDGRFWYRRDGDDGPEFVVVTVEGSKALAFDHAALGRGLDEVMGNAAAGTALPATLANVQLSDDLRHLSAQIGGKSLEFNFATLAHRSSDAPAPAPDLIASPDGRWAAFTRDDNLFVRETATGIQRQLTTDGGPFYSWAKIPDSALTTVVRKKAAQRTPPFEVQWSPDGRYLIAPRIDERKVAVNPVVEWVPTDGSPRPIVHEVRLTFSGDRDAIDAAYALFDLETGRSFPIELPEGYRPNLTGLVLGWSRGRSQAFILGHTIGWRSASVFRLDLETGLLAKVLEESSDTRVETNSLLYSQPNIRVLGDGDELIWYSDRTGWGHLYLYDAQTGALKNAITSGDWLALDIHAVDEGRREVYFTAVGREQGRDPYFRHLYRGGLDDSGGVTLLTEPDADHHFQPTVSAYTARLYGLTPREPLIAPSFGVFIDTWSRVDQPPVTALRSTRDGQLTVELERADASRLYEAGWTPPVRECVKAADGKTDLYAAYFPPHRRCDAATYPVIDAAYGGPQVVVTPRNFTQAYSAANPIGENALARLGFAVVTVDARGTPMRSSAFRDAGYVEFTQVGVEDHIAAIRDLAQRHPEMDVSRVGVYGWSWGGTFSAQAILSQPEFYKVAVSGAGLYDYAATYPGAENFTGVPEYGDGTRYRGKPDEAPANWSKLDVTRLAHQLVGHLLVAYGDMDENVLPHQALRLVDALTKANKPYDLLYLPNRTHAGMFDGYMIKRTWDYFVEHLLDMPTLADFKVEMRPIAPR